jgi:hypothetical protein
MKNSNLERKLIEKAKKLMLDNPNVDFETLAERFIKDQIHRGSAVNEMMLRDCLTEAHEQIIEQKGKKFVLGGAIQEHMGAGDLDSFEKGGGLPKGAKLKLTMYSVDVYEDDYEQGELDHVNYWSQSLNKTFDSPDEAFKWIADNVLFDYHKEVQPKDFVVLDGRVIYSRLNDANNSKADKLQIAEWKKGKKKLYSASYDFYFEAVSNLSDEQLSKILGVELYKKGGKIKKRSTQAIRRDRVWTSNQPHEQAYKSKRKSAIRRHGVDSARDSQEPHEVATRKKTYLVGGDLDHIMLQMGGDLDHVMLLKGGDLDHIPFKFGGTLEDAEKIVKNRDYFKNADELSLNQTQDELRYLRSIRKSGDYKRSKTSQRMNDAGIVFLTHLLKKKKEDWKNAPRLKRGDLLEIAGRKWFDSTYGNTYHSVTVYVNDKFVAKHPFSYGYGDQYIQTGLKLLWDWYKKPYGWKESTSIYSLKEKGIKVVTHSEDVLKRDLEDGGLIDDLTPERDLIVPFGKGGEIMDKIKSGDYITEREMKLITRRMNNDKLDPEMREVIQYIWDNDVAIDPNGEWSKKGLKFLMNQWKSPTGKIRKNNPFGQRETDILENFDHFELAGFYDVSRYGGVSYYVPLYDVCDDEGWCFQYYYDGKVNIVGLMGGLFGSPKRSTHAIRMDRMWSSNQPHEVAYRSKRKSPIKRSGKDRKLDSQEPHEVATRKAMEHGGFVVAEDMNASDLESFKQGGQTYARGGEIENASDLYDKHFEKYPYATELIAHYIFGVDEDNDVYN